MSGAGQRISKVIGNNRAYKLVGDVAQMIQFDLATTSDSDFTAYPGLGVICIHERDQYDQRQYGELEQAGIALTLFNEGANGELEANPKAVFRLINFLILTKLRARMMEGRDYVNVRLLNSEGVEVAMPDVSAKPRTIESEPKILLPLNSGGSNTTVVISNWPTSKP